MCALFSAFTVGQSIKSMIQKDQYIELFITGIIVSCLFIFGFSNMPLERKVKHA